MLDFDYKVDKQEMLKTYLNWVDQVNYILSLNISCPSKFRVKQGYREYSPPKNIVICGLGGSGIAGDLVKDALGEKIKVPIEVVKDYTLPPYSGEETLVIAISYSGNTEETLSCYVQATEKNCMVASISSGGYLKTFAEKTGGLHILLRPGYQPRASLPQLFFAVTRILECLNIVPKIDYSEAIKILEENKESLSPDKKDNEAMKLAKRLYQKIPVKAGGWDRDLPGWVQVDLVEHCGQSASGYFANTISLCDIATGWWEGEVVLGRTGKDALMP